MTQRLYTIGATLLCATLLCAQTPKWLKKTAKAQLTVMTIDAQGQLKGSGKAFFVDERGTAVANYELFRGAASAKAAGLDHKEYEADLILGANALYDVAKFSVRTDKKTPYIPTATRKGSQGQPVYILTGEEKKPYLTDTIVQVQQFGAEGYSYYTLKRTLPADYVNCPVVDTDGQLLALVQRSAGTMTQATYAIGIDYALQLGINALSATDSDLNGIGLPKALPSDLNDARTYIYMIAARTDSATYDGYLNRYVAQFATESETYARRADFYMARGNYAAAEADMEQAIALSKNKDEEYYTYARLIYNLNLKQGYVQYKDWDLNKALYYVREANKAKPQPHYTLQEAHTLFALKQYDEAAALYLQLNDTPMRCADNFLYAAQCKKMTEQPDTAAILALQDSAVACHKQPYTREAATALIERAQTLADLGQYRRAVLDMNEYEKVMGNRLTAHFYYRREQAEMRCRMYQQALDDMDRAVRMAPGEPLYHLEQAVVRYTVGHLEDAIASIDKCLALTQDYPEAYRIKGLCLRQQGKKEEADACLKQAAEAGDTIARQLLEEAQ